MQLLLTISIFDQLFALALRNFSAFCIVRWNTLKSEQIHFESDLCIPLRILLRAKHLRWR